MNSFIDIEQVLNDWQKTANNMLTATSERDYQGYKQSFAQGLRHFSQVKFYLNENTVNDSNLKNKIKATASLWTSTVKGLRLWQVDIGLELENTKKRRKKKSKLRQSYSIHKKTTGLNISRKRSK